MRNSRRIEINSLPVYKIISTQKLFDELSELNFSRGKRPAGYDKIHRNMITSHEHSDIVHIMKMNRLKLVDSDTAHLEFGGQIKGLDYRITIHAVEDSPTVIIKKKKEVVFTDTVKSVDDLKIFLEEQMYKYLEM